MSFFANLSEIIASLSPRRPRHQPEDRQRSDADSLHHSGSPRRVSRSPSSKASRRVKVRRNELSLGSGLDDTLSEARLSPRHTARPQVCDSQHTCPALWQELALFSLRRDASLQPQRWSLLPAQIQLLFLSSSSTYFFDVGTNHSQTTQSYANDSHSSPGPTNTRRRLRSPSSQFVIDLTAR